MINTFKQNQAAFIFLFPLMVILIWIPSWFSESQIILNFDSGPLFQVLFNWIYDLKWASITIANLLIILQLILITNIANYYKLLRTNTYLQALFFFVLIHSIYPFFSLNSMLIASTFSIIILYKLLKIYGEKNSFKTAFDCGFLIAIATLFFPPAIIFLAFIFLAFIVLRPFAWRDYAITLTGFLIPFILFYACIYIFDLPTKLNIFKYFNLFYTKPIITHYKQYYLPIFSSIVFLTLLSVIYIRSTFNTRKIRNRKTYTLLFYYIGLSILITFISSSWSFHYFVFIPVPLSFILADYFYSIDKKWIQYILFYGLIIAVGIHYFWRYIIP